jgi:hypothetical protein
MSKATGQGGIDYQDGGFYAGHGGYPVTKDLAELAARLGSICTYDRRGTVFLLEDFQEGMPAWVPATGGTGAEVKMTTNYPYCGAYAVRLIAGSDSGQQTSIATYMNPQEVARWGLETGVAFFTDFDQFRIEIQRLDGSYRHVTKAIIHKGEGKLMYEKSGGGNVAIADLPTLVASFGIYHSLKIVGDFGDKELIRIMFNQDEYDLSGIEMTKYADSSLPHVLLRFTFVGREGENDWCQVGYAISTQNEPP